MYSYFIGTVTDISGNSIILEVNKIGYLVFVPNPFSYEIGKEYKVYVYNKIAEDEYSLYGFKTKEEYELFLRLISVKGLGAKIALPILATGSIGGIVDAIDRENVLYLTKFPKIGEKLARQIILDLKGKINIEVSGDVANDETEDLIDTLSALGYKTAEIKKVIVQINSSNSLEEQVKEALKLLLKQVMMKKNGFTLVELLAVVVIIAIITAIGSVGITAVKKNINNNLWESTVRLIESGAARYGDDYKNRLKNTCEVDGVTKYSCLTVKVQYLIDKNYIKTKETDDGNKKVLVDKRVEKDEAGYYINDYYVSIYLEDNIVYARYIGSTVQAVLFVMFCRIMSKSLHFKDTFV